MNREMVSTGAAARLCSVTPDTVLKWIKKDRIRAVKTPGGHYRIDKKELKPYLSGLGQDDAPAVEPVPKAISYCWEYHADNGQIRDSCRECMVFRSKAEKCYLMAEMGEKAGHARTFCQKGCRACDYLQFVNDKPANVLVVTENTELQSRLSTGVRDGMVLRSSCCEYETATVIQDFSPDFIVIDESLAGSSSDEICRHLIDDPRVHGAQIVLASADRNTGARLPDGVCASIRVPFTASDLWECLRNLNQSSSGKRPVAQN